MTQYLRHSIHYAGSGTPTGTAYVLHGILGSRRNWASMARRFAQSYPEWEFIVVDLRGHGDSHGFPGPQTVRHCAEDILDLAGHLGRYPDIVIGHSFGGKVALAYGCLNPGGLRHIWCLDSSPGRLEARSGAALDGIIHTIREVPLPVAHRLAMVPYFEERGFDRAIGAWMTTNLTKGRGGFVWRFDLDVIQELVDDYRSLDYWTYLEDSRRRPKVHFLLAERTQWWRGMVHDRLTKIDEIELHTLENAGHWVHIDNPEGVIEILGATFAGLP